MTPSQAPTLASEILNHLSSKSLIPSQAWLRSFLVTQRPTTPLAALKQTALFRLLASDITTSLSSFPHSCFPSNIGDATVKELHLQGPIVVQILNIEDMSKSRWEQIEAIEALERGEGTRGREVIRVVPGEDGDNQENARKGRGPHKVLLQDVKGTAAYGVELKDIEGLSLAMNIGSKMVLRNAIVARGLLLLEPQTTTLLGGKIDSLHTAWKTNRKEELKAALEMNRQS
ncbi:MAG: hypothetical protein M1834_007965 [Cirrosporium novae-zelandiae]|nr:MAG: hypothetical protein M1834_007965 [Cirrosporium novae-zelandiae]